MVTRYILPVWIPVSIRFLMIMLKSKKMHTIKFLHFMLLLWSTLYQTAVGADEVCGQSSYEDSEDSMRLSDSSGLGKINATEGAWPWMAAIRVLERTGIYSPWCSGFLIDRRHVLSAAHCFEDRNKAYRVRIGRNNQNEGDEYRITGIAVPPGYKSGWYYDNIALLTLDQDVNTQNYNPICLPDEKVRKMVLTGQTATVAGWGSDKPAGETSMYLKQINGMPIARNQECQRTFRQALGNRFRRQFPHGINKNFLCAGFIEGKRDVCGGDSGGPLMIKYRNRWFAVGITSFGISCGVAGMPSGYTNVSNYLEWIKENVRVCGDSNLSVRLGAGNATKGAWPWMVAIRKRENSNYVFLCSGFLIDRRHVLSAAHCYEKQNNMDQYRARIGNINQDEGEEYLITQIVIHPGFTFAQGMFNDDIAILTLDREVNFHNFNPICLPDQEIKEMDLKGKLTAIAAWESAITGGERVNYLQQLNGLPVISSKDCEQKYREVLRQSSFRRQFPFGIDNRYICAEYPNGAKCLRDDSGGPLMMQKGNRWYVVGIISFGFRCVSGMPGGYTNVSNYLDWIKENVRDKLVCGTSQSVLPSLVVGNATERAWPWMAAIRRRESSGIYLFRCTGFLIDRRHVLSAAHCHDAENNDQYKVHIGSIDPDKGEEYRVSRIAIPEGYTTGTFYDDIAVLTLDREVNIPNYNSVCLPDEQVSSIDLSGRSSTLVGWKTNSKGGNYLQQLGRLPIIYNQECQRIYGQFLGSTFQRQFPIGINRGFICAGYVDGGKDYCEFSSGAPLMIQIKNQWYAVGVLSFGVCPRLEIPDGFVKISNYLDWIKENTED